MKMIDFFGSNYDKLLQIFNSLKIGVWITDGDGKVILVNDKSAAGMRNDVMGKSMHELLEIGYIINESSVLKALKSHCEESIIQEWGQGGYIQATSIPVMNKGHVELVICTERDITETINLQELLERQENISKKYETELAHLRKQEIVRKGTVISESVSMQNIVDTAIRIGRLDATIMITGESGTGKELIANLIYDNSNRKGKPFIKVNCAAIPENLMESEFFGYEKGSFTGASKEGKIGFFELADEGTLFLDEIGDLPIAMQSKLLRVLQEKEIRRIGGRETIPVNVRIIAATNKDLKKAIQKGDFREDLFYRLDVIPIELPPLRERKEDIPKLVKYFVEDFSREYGMKKQLDEDAVGLFMDYYWPGNIRELRNVIERLVVSTPGTKITGFQVRKQFNSKEKGEDKIPIEQSYEGSLEDIVAEFERNLLSTYLEKEGNITNAAKALHVNKSTISRKAKKYGI